MDFSFDIFQIYQQFCDIISGVYPQEAQGHMLDDESQKMRCSREELVKLLQVVQSKLGTRLSVLDEVSYKLMPRLELKADFPEFSRFYDFVFFICRENGQKSITVSKAVTAWRLVLDGRFRLLNEWCNFIERNQRHNISEDTWQQVLAFSRSVHESFEGYDPEGAWPVLIDEFVEHMYRIRGSHGASKLLCNCYSSDTQQYEDMPTGTVKLLKSCPGSKRKASDNMLIDQEHSDGYSNPINISNSKRRSVNFVDNSINNGQNQLPSSPFSCTKSPCAAEGSLSKGFAGLFSDHSSLHFDQDRRISYT